MDERKSWKWIIFAYGGAAAVLAVITTFFVRGATHSDVAIVNGYATATPTVVNVYNGIRPDAQSPWIHAKPEPAAASPSPTPVASGTPGPHPSGLESKALASTLKPATLPKHPAAQHAAHPHPASETGGVVASHPADNPNPAPPVEVAQVTKATDAPANPVPEATQAPTAAPVAPPPATPAAPAQDSVPIYAPERIVDAQVRTAAQPDFPDADRERGEHGTSVVLVTIDPKGNVVSTSVSSSSGYPALDRAAVAAARESQFVAPKINGHPATETYRLVYDFTP